MQLLCQHVVLVPETGVLGLLQSSALLKLLQLIISEWKKTKATALPAKESNPTAPSDATKRKSTEDSPVKFVKEQHQSKKARKKELARVVKELGKANSEPNRERPPVFA
ncbi:hypothetical protein PENFLA_c070G04963 [Penicillium flavigenum]|uniref:Uncharacterized protein n=1 Tax=Penicillium flavigenum TaxID=254877 RepID=A0A1V6SE71_9EURO|nr:hypothetical protein PENFLA_c070G04963 [Penicillium flavigenum]